MSDKVKDVREQLMAHGDAIQKSMSDVSDAAKRAIDNINAGFDEAQRRVDEMQRLADFVVGKPPKDMANQHYGIVHGGEFVMSRADHKVKRDLLDKHYESENLTRSIDDGDVTITINVPN